MERTKGKYNCPLINKEVNTVEGSVTTGNGVKIPQHGCELERKCEHKHEKDCFAYTPR